VLQRVATRDDPVVIGKFAFSSWISTNAVNKENTVLFDRYLISRVGVFDDR